MAKHNSKAAGKVAEAAKEGAMLRMLRIDGSQNGATLRTRVVRDKTKYNRNVKHKKSLADARDFAFICCRMPGRLPSGNTGRRGNSLLSLNRTLRAASARFR